MIFLISTYDPIYLTLPPFDSYYDSDADLNVLKDKTIVFLGYVVYYIIFRVSRNSKKYSFGNQGAAQAQNLRDTGIPNDKIIVANRPDHYAEDAKSRGFTVEHDFAKAASAADGAFTTD